MRAFVPRSWWLAAAVGLAVAPSASCADDESGTPGPSVVIGGSAGTHAGGTGAAAGAGGTGLTTSSGGQGTGGSGGEGGSPWTPVDTEWCAEGWIGLDEATCAYLPADLGPSAPLLVYLHGMMPPDSLPTSQQALASAAADRNGFVALFPRGRQGLCAWDVSVETWWCWPTSRQNVDAHAASITAEWDASIDVIEHGLGVGVTDRHVLGFSNGGYFAAYLGLENLWWTEGIGVVAAGRSYVDESLLGDHQAPFYIAVGALDQQSVQQSAENLAWVLTLHDWPHEYVLHPNRGHELGPDDFDDGWQLWTGG